MDTLRPMQAPTEQNSNDVRRHSAVSLRVIIVPMFTKFLHCFSSPENNNFKNQERKYRDEMLTG